MAREAETVAAATGDPVGPHGALLVAAWRGHAGRGHPAGRRRHGRLGGAGGRAAADRRRLGHRRAQQWPEPLRRGPGRGRAGQCGSGRPRPGRLVAGRADRSGGPDRGAGACVRCPPAAFAADRRRRHRLGPRASRPGPRRCSAGTSRPSPCISRRSSGSAGPGSAPSWPAPTSCTASGCAARAAAVTPGSSCAPRTSMLDAMGMAGFRRTGPQGTGGHRRDRPQTHGRDGERAHRAGGADRPAGPQRAQ